MQQKSLRYLLIAAVLFIWGAILVKAFDVLGADQTISAEQVVETPLPVYEEQADTTRLLQNYNDPFLSVNEEDVANSIIDKPNATANNIPAGALSVPLPQPEQVDISFIKYSGMFANPAKKIKTAIISIRGREAVVKEQSTIDGVTIKMITPEKIDILYKGKKYSIAK